MTEQHCDEVTNQACALRHKAQDESKEQIKEIYEIICGGTCPENSMKTKVDTLFKERNETRGWLVANLFTVLIIFFWCGYQYSVLQGHTEAINKIENRLDAMALTK